MAEAERTIDLRARQEIVDQIYLYCRAMDRIDNEIGYSVFHEDSIADYSPAFLGTGREFVDWVSVQHRHLIGQSHQVANILVNIEGDRAGSESYFRATLRYEQDGVIMERMCHGRYCDEWSRRDGRWAIVRRRGLSDFDSVREAGPAMMEATGRRDREDTSYAVLSSSP